MVTGITAIVLSKNNDDTLDLCLRSVIASSPKSKEIIVVDAHSTDNTPRILAKYGDKIKVVYDEGRGLGLARNTGMKATTNNIVAFVDSDVYCSRDHFQKFLNYFNKHKDVVAIDTPGAHPIFGTVPQKLESKLYRIFDEKPQECLRGWCIGCRRSAYAAVGGFFAVGSDDTEFSYNLMEKGLKLGTVETESVHIPRQTLSSLIKEMMLWGKNASKYNWSKSHMLKHYLRRRKLMRFIDSPWLANLVPRLLAPLLVFKYVIKAKTLSLYPYYVLRQWAYAFGFVRG